MAIAVAAATLFAFWLLSSTAGAAGPEISDKDLNISLKLPDGFEPIPDFSSPPNADIRYAYMRPEPNGGPAVMVFVQQLGGVLGLERVGEEEARKRGITGVYLEKWKSFEVQVFLVKERVGDDTFVTRNAQVPITPRAIQLKITGPESQDAELANLTRTLLASLDGPTNWLTDWERGENLGVAIVQFLAWIVGIGVAVYILVARQTSVFRGRVVERGHPVALARQRIRPGWAWYLLGAYLFYATIVASCGIVVTSLISRLEKHQTLEGDNSLWYSLGVLVLGSLLASAITGIVMWHRVKYKRRILATPLPLPAPSGSSPE